MPLLTLNLRCENVKYPARKHFEKTNINRKMKSKKKKRIFFATFIYFEMDSTEIVIIRLIIKSP